MRDTREGRDPSKLWRATRIGVAAAILLIALAFAIDPLSLRVPHWVTWQRRDLTADLDGNASLEQVSLAHGVLEVRDSSGAKIFRSPSSWKPQDAVICDVTHDGKPEIVLLVWRRGNYGSSRPFWENDVDLRMTEHLYVMGMREGKVVPVWMGHELGREVVEVAAHEDGSISLVERDGTNTHWSWEGFGFVVL